MTASLMRRKWLGLLLSLATATALAGPPGAPPSRPDRSAAFQRYFRLPGPRRRLLEFFCFALSFSTLVGGMATQTLNRIMFDGKGGATAAERWSVGHRIRDVEVGPDGAVWMLEDANPGGLFRVTPPVTTK